MKGVFLFVAVAAAIVACGGKRGDDAKALATAAPSSSTRLPELVNPRAEAIPTEQDFEEEAARDISPANLEAELAKLKEEIKP